jgi:hypothetical protein
LKKRGPKTHSWRKIKMGQDISDKEKKQATPNMLPIVEYNGKQYFVDCRLKEFRPVEPPLEFITFDSELGREIENAWDEDD